MSAQHRRIGIAAGAAALAAMAVAGCSASAGSSSAARPGTASGGDGAAIALVADAMAQAGKAGTVKLTGTLTTGGQSSVTENLSGQVQYSPDLEVSLSTAANGQEISDVVIGTTAYVRYPALSSMTDGKPWAKIDLAKAGGTAGVFATILDQAENFNPTTLLSALLASDDVAEVGQETVDGQQTTHYAGTLTAARLVALGTTTAHLTADQVDLLRAEFKAAGVKSETIDAWVGADKLPVEIRGLQQAASSSVKVDMHLSDWGAKVNIGAPPADQVYDLTSKLGSLGSLGG